MATKAQAQFSQILEEIDLTQFIRQVFEFKLITKRELMGMKKAFSGSYGGIKVVIDNRTPTPTTSTIIVVFFGDNQLGVWFDGRYFGMADVIDLIKFINHPPSKK